MTLSITESPFFKILHVLHNKEVLSSSFILELSHHHKKTEEQINQRVTYLEPVSKGAQLCTESQALELFITIKHKLRKYNDI